MVAPLRHIDLQLVSLQNHLQTVIVSEIFKKNEKKKTKTKTKILIF